MIAELSDGFGSKADKHSLIRNGNRQAIGSTELDELAQIGFFRGHSSVKICKHV